MSCKKTLVAPGPNSHIWRNLISQMPSLLKLGFASRLFRRNFFYFPWSASFYGEPEIAYYHFSRDFFVLFLTFFFSMVSLVLWRARDCLIAYYHFSRDFMFFFLTFLFSMVLSLIWKKVWGRLVLVLICYFPYFLSDPSPIIGNACHSLTNSLTHSLTHSRLVNLIDVTLACEDANSKLVEVCYWC